MIKKISIYLILLTMIFSCFSDVNAESFAIKEISNVNPTITASGKDSPGYGGAAKLTLSNGDVVYCTDPYAPSPSSSATLREVKINPADEAAYRSIFMATEGNEDLRVAATKTYITNYGEETVGYNEKTAGVYKDVITGKASYTGSGSQEDFLKVVNNAKVASETPVSKPVSSKPTYQEGENRLVIKGKKDSYEVIPGSGVSCIPNDSGEETITTCKIENSICSTTGGDSSVIVKYAAPTDSDAGKETCDPKMYEVDNGAPGRNVQRFVSCPKKEFTETPVGDGTIEETKQISCDAPDPEDDDCDIPCEQYINNYPSDNEGTEMCDPSGEVVIDYSEWDHNDLYTEEEVRCCMDQIAMDDPLYGAAISADEILFPDNELGLCNAYCYEDVEIELPGPTSDNYDSVVMVNAGTFFTIDDSEMKSVSTITCVVKPDYELLVSKVNDLREKVATLITEYNKAQASQNVDVTPRTVPIHDYEWVPCDDDGDGVKDELCNEYVLQGYEYYLDYEAEWKAVFFDRSGENGGNYSIYTEDEEGSCEVSGPSVSSCDAIDSLKATSTSVTMGDINDAIAALDYSNADSTLSKILKEWNNCFNWDFQEYNDRLEADRGLCHPIIEFTYEDGEYMGLYPKIVVDDVDPDGDVVTSSSSEQKNLKIGTCNSSGSSCDNINSKKVDKPDLSYGSDIVTVKYKFQNEFCAPYDENDYVRFLAPGESCDNGVTLKGFPVSFDTPQGRYSYNYSYYNLGRYYTLDSSICGGRLDGVIAPNYPESGWDNTCVYDVNSCKSCDVECIDKSGVGFDGGCDIDFHSPCNGRCQVACVGGGCLLDFGTGLLATYRTMSLNDPFPIAIRILENNLGASSLLALASTTSDVSSTRNFPGSNWRTDKGELVKDQIQIDGENIYSGTPEYSIRLDPVTINAIRDYNEMLGYDYLSKSSGTFEVKGDYAIYKSSFIRDNFQSEFIEGNNRGIGEWHSYGEFFGRDYTGESFTGPALK